MLIDLLYKSGLSTSEAETYETLLILSRATPAEISGYTRTTRENTYKVLEQLERRGFVSKVLQSKKFTYAANHPKLLLDQLQQQQLELEQSKDALSAVIKDYEAQLEQKREQPIVQYFEGEEGYKAAYMQSIIGNSDIHYEIMHRKWDPNFKKWMDKTFIPERVKRGISKRILIANDTIQTPELVKRNSNELRATVSCPTNKFPEGNHVISNKDKTAFLVVSSAKNHAQETIIIKHQKFAMAIYRILEGILDKLAKNSNVHRHIRKNRT